MGNHLPHLNRECASMSGNLVRLRIVRGTLNNQILRRDYAQVVVAAKAEIIGSVELEYLARWTAAAVFLCATPTWGSRETAGWTVHPLVTPVDWTTRRAAIKLRAPAVPGRYHLIFAVQAERSCDFMLSATNWTTGTPVWGDGNDLVDWDSSALAHARSRGWVPVPMLRRDPATGRTEIPTAPFGAAVIEVVVR